MAEGQHNTQHGAIAIIGAGTLGRRIGLMLSTQPGEVRLFDTSESARQSGLAFIEDNLPQVLAKRDRNEPAALRGVDTLEEALRNAWLVIEAVPEDLELKKTIFSKLDELSAPETILATNSSSYPSREMLDGVKHPERVLNLHFYMPPLINAVELMSCGVTRQDILDDLMQRLPAYGLSPFLVRRESVGFIFNRIWAAIKRESLQVVAEGVASPSDVDGLFKLFTGGPIGPFRGMDAVGLDVVLAIEEHYAALHPTLPPEPRELLRSYVEKGWLGAKSGQGFYEYH